MTLSKVNRDLQRQGIKRSRGVYHILPSGSLIDWYRPSLELSTRAENSKHCALAGDFDEHYVYIYIYLVYIHIYTYFLYINVTQP